MQSTLLYEEWVRWATAEGCEPVGRNTFSELVGKRDGITMTRSNGKRWFNGIGLKIGTDDDE